MRLVDILAGMKSEARRKLAGEIVEAEIPRQGLTRERAADAMHMAPGTLDRIRKGDPTLQFSNRQAPKLRSVEGVLNFPRFLLAYIWEGDADAIAAIPGKGEDPITGMDEDLRRVILDKLARIDAEEVEDDENNHQAR